MPPLDRIDRTILAELQRNNRITNADLAERAGLSAPACLRRVRRLRQQGYVAADIALLDRRKLGPLTTVVVQVRMERGSSDVLDAFKRRMQADPRVAQCYLVTGAVDFVLVVNVRTMEDYQAFLEKVLYDDPTVKEMSSLVVVSRVKFSTALPLD